jgi:hypothetical protein
MALLHIEAIVTNDVARPGTTDPVPVTVSVTRSNGNPVNTLTLDNFTVGNTWGTSGIAVIGFQGGRIQIGPGATNAGGLYMMQLVPSAVGGSVSWVTWTTYHIVFVVQAGTDRGQTIAHLTFPKP